MLVHAVPEALFPVALQTCAPAEHDVVPVRHSAAGVHAADVMLSTVPSQLSSTLLQTSALGEPAVTLHAVVVPEHMIVPVRMHPPTPALHAVPVARQVPPQFD